MSESEIYNVLECGECDQDGIGMRWTEVVVC